MSILRKAVLIDTAFALGGYGFAIFERGVTWDTFVVVPVASMVLAWAWATEYGPPAEPPLPPGPTRRERREAHREAISKRLASFAGDVRGVTAVEAGFILPLFCVAILGAVDVYQAMQQRSAVNFAATSAALIGGRTLKKSEPTTCDPAKAAAQAAYEAAVQSGIFMFGAQPSLGSMECTNDNTAMQVTVSSTSNALFPLIGLPQFSATVTVRG